MYAVIKTGGKQYRVMKDDVLHVELLDAKKGDTLKILEVLMVGSEGKATIGSPTIAGASVSAEVVDHIKDDKVIVFKKKRRQNYRRKNGHRQNYTVLKITGITG
ncbi:MAG: 50S ribosomal protein L21 [Micavibrio sp.]|nr:50S ribosomal protein L21 [Micavibrio sp.]